MTIRMETLANVPQVNFLTSKKEHRQSAMVKQNYPKHALANLLIPRKLVLHKLATMWNFNKNVGQNFKKGKQIIIFEIAWHVVVAVVL